MKKKLREQLILLAQQIIKEEESFKTTQIRKSVLDLYNQLGILEYLENQIEGSSETPIQESLDSKSFREENWFVEPEPVPQPVDREDLAEPLMEKIKDIVAQMPEESEQIDELLDSLLPHVDEKPEQSQIEIKEVPAVGHSQTELPKNDPPKNEPTRNELEEFASAYQQMPEFERKNPELFPPSTGMKPASKNVTESKSKSLNDTINTGLSVGLNDRLAFIKHLFEGQTEDYTRVLSQINTMSSFEEAESFIKENVKPDYHHWHNKDEYSQRFMLIIEKSFNKGF